MEYPSGAVGHHMHAERNVLRFYKPGDKLIVMRFSKSGELTMAKPCKFCQEKIESLGVTQVTYSNWEGEFERL